MSRIDEHEKFISIGRVMTIYCYLIGVRLEHAWVRRQLEGAKPYWVDCHLQSRVSKCCKQD